VGDSHQGTAILPPEQAGRGQAARKRRRLRLAKRPILFRRGLAAAILLLALAACSTSGARPAATPARQSASGSASAYVGCLLKHFEDNGKGGARKACRSRRPADGLSAFLHTFASCLKSHGETLPSMPPEAGGRGILRRIAQLKSGGSAERHAFNSCMPG
jgi:hypothetical protein